LSTDSIYPHKLKELLEELSSIEDMSLRSDLLIEYAEAFKPVPKEVAHKPFPERSKVPACESEAYVWAQKDSESKLKFYFAVENPQGISAMAMAAILDETLSGELPEAVANIEADIVYEIFGRGISMGKGQGLMAMVSMVKNLAKNECKKIGS